MVGRSEISESKQNQPRQQTVQKKSLAYGYVLLVKLAVSYDATTAVSYDATTAVSYDATTG